MLQIIFSRDNLRHMQIIKKIIPSSDFTQNLAAPKINYIRGILESGEHVLLSRCVPVRAYSVNLVWNVFLRVSCMFAGDVRPSIPIKGNRISIPYTSLYTWLWPETIGNFKENIEENTGVSGMSFTHTPPKNITIEFSNGFSLEFNYGHEISIPAVIKDFTIQQSASVALRSKSTLDLNILRSRIAPFRNFLMIATNTRVQPKSLSMQISDSMFTVFSDYNFYDGIDEEQEITKMNFNYHQIKNNFEKVLKQWFEYHLKYEEALNLYFAAKLDFPLLPLTITFLRIVQSLEALHRIKYGEEMDLKARLV